MVTFQGEEAVETVEPWDDGRVVEISYFPMYSQFRLSVKMPSGMPERVDNDDVQDKDIEFLEWVVNNHTDHSFRGMLDSDDFEQKHLAFLIMMVIETIVDDYEAPEWEEYSSDMPSFIERGSLGVK